MSPNVHFLRIFKKDMTFGDICPDMWRHILETFGGVWRQLETFEDMTFGDI